VTTPIATSLNPPTTPDIIDLESFDEIPIAQILAGMVLLGIVTDITNPALFAATMEAFQTQAALTVPVLMGGQGNPGSTAMTLRFQNDNFTQTAQLPTDLGNFPGDIGKFWVLPVFDLTISDDPVATTIYIWTGIKGTIPPGSSVTAQGFVQLPVGQPGSPGIYPDIQPQLILTETGSGLGPNDSDSFVSVNDGGVQVITFSAAPTSGQFNITVNIGGTIATTTEIQFSAITAAGLKSAFNALSNIAGGVEVIQASPNETFPPVVQGVPGPFTVLFSGMADSETVDPLIFTSSLVGATISVSSGTAAAPEQAFYLAAPQGFEGPSTALGAMFDVDLVSTAPASGDHFGVSDRVTPGAPTGLAVTPSTTGGTFPAGEVFWFVTATMPNGETEPAAAVSTTFTGTTSKAVLHWISPSGGGATGFNVYRGSAADAINELVAVITSGTMTSFTDTGAAGISKTPTTTPLPAGLPIWVPLTPEFATPKVFTSPQSNFIPAIGIEFDIFGIESGPVPICVFTVPPQPGPWVPMVWGQLQVVGISLSLSPLLVAADVLLNNSQLVAIGHGNSLGTITLFPEYGSQVTPTNGVALVPAGEAAEFTVEITNTGAIIGAFDFNPPNAALSILVVPVELPQTGTSFAAGNFELNATATLKLMEVAASAEFEMSATATLHRALSVPGKFTLNATATLTLT
jgi:hypothetical protein